MTGTENTRKYKRKRENERIKTGNGIEIIEKENGIHDDIGVCVEVEKKRKKMRIKKNYSKLNASDSFLLGFIPTLIHDRVYCLPFHITHLTKFLIG